MTKERDMTTPENEMFDPGQLAVITTTFYKGWYPGEVNRNGDLASLTDKVRGDLALETLAAAEKKGYQISIVDGGSSEEFKQRLTEARINWHDQAEKGMSGSRRQALGEGLKLKGVKYLAWTEPEKVSMVEDGILENAARMIREGRADMVIPKRSGESQATYPKQQIDSEKEANRQMNDLLVSRGLLKPEEADLDLMVGPRIFRNDKELVNLFFDKYLFETDRPAALQKWIKPDSYNNFLFFTVPAALAKGFTVRSLEADYQHPAIQTKMEEGQPEYDAKRIEQRIGIITGMTYYVDWLIGNNRNTHGKITKKLED